MRWLAVVLCGCGRFGFDSASSAPDDAPTPDAFIPDTSPIDADLRACAERIPDLTGRFTFDGTADEVTHGLSATEQGNPTYGEGRTGQAVILDGVDDRIDLPAELAVADYAIAFWVRTTDLGTGMTGDLWFAGKSLLDAEVCGAPVTGDFGIALIDGGHVNSSVLTQPTVETINDDAWHHLVLTRSISPNEEFLYLDGVEVSRDTGSAVPHTEIPFIGLGNNPCRTNGNNNLAGRFDEVVFYDRAISAIEVAALAACVDP